MAEEHARRIGLANTGKRRTPEQREAMKCKPDCTCPRHTARNSGQFQPGSAGFARPHTAETKAKLAAYTGPQASSYKHGWSDTPTYRTWSAMLSRCYDPRNASYPRYGGRGITVCDRWRDFENFLADMGPRPGLNHSIDRIDPDGNYELSNCRWLTRAENSSRARRGKQRQ